MDTMLTRRDALATAGIVACTAAWTAPRTLIASARAPAHEPPAQPLGSPWPDFPYQDRALVREMVGVCHRDLARATELVTAEPALVHAAWDWGFGDWETALGAAAHTGRREIAEMLLARGARLDIFAAASLGMTAAVKAMIEAQPGIQRAWGPHGITLAAHARAGDERAKETLEYLVSLGDADTPIAMQEISDEARKVYEGEYAFGPGATERLTVKVNKQWLEVTRGADSARRIFSVGDHAFFPSGVPAARLKFDVEGGVSRALEVQVGGRVVKAVRA